MVETDELIEQAEAEIAYPDETDRLIQEVESEALIDQHREAETQRLIDEHARQSQIATRPIEQYIAMPETREAVLGRERQFDEFEGVPLMPEHRDLAVKMRRKYGGAFDPWSLTAPHLEEAHLQPPRPELSQQRETEFSRAARRRGTLEYEFLQVQKERRRDYVLALPPGTEVASEPFKGGIAAQIAEAARRGLESVRADQRLMEAALKAESVDDSLFKTTFKDWTKAKRIEEIEPIEPHYLAEPFVQAARIAPPMVESAVKAVPIAAEAGLAGAIVGTAVAPGPGTAIGFTTGARIGMTGKMAHYWYQQGAGEMLGEMLSQGYDFKTSRLVSLIAAAPYAAIEFIQIKGLTPAIKQGAKEVALKSLRRFLIDRAKTVANETVEEIAQQAIMIAARDLARYYSGMGLKVDKQYIEDRLNELVETGKQTIGPMGVLAGISGTIGTAANLALARPTSETAAPPVAPARPLAAPTGPTEVPTGVLPPMAIEPAPTVPVAPAIRAERRGAPRIELTAPFLEDAQSVNGRAILRRAYGQLTRDLEKAPSERQPQIQQERKDIADSLKAAGYSIEEPAKPVPAEAAKVPEVGAKPTGQMIGKQITPTREQNRLARAAKIADAVEQGKISLRKARLGAPTLWPTVKAELARRKVVPSEGAKVPKVGAVEAKREETPLKITTIKGKSAEWQTLFNYLINRRVLLSPGETMRRQDLERASDEAIEFERNLDADDKIRLSRIPLERLEKYSDRMTAGENLVLEKVLREEGKPDEAKAAQPVGLRAEDFETPAEEAERRKAVLRSARDFAAPSPVLENVGGQIVWWSGHEYEDAIRNAQQRAPGIKKYFKKLPKPTKKGYGWDEALQHAIDNNLISETATFEDYLWAMSEDAQFASAVRRGDVDFLETHGFAQLPVEQPVTETKELTETKKELPAERVLETPPAPSAAGYEKEMAEFAATAQPRKGKKQIAIEKAIAKIEHRIDSLGAKNPKLAAALKEQANQLKEQLRKSGVLKLRQKIMGAAQVRLKKGTMTQSQFDGMKKQFLGTSRLTKSTDTDKLADLLGAIQSQPNVPGATKKAMLLAKRLGLTKKVYEYDPQTGEETFENALMGGRIVGTGKNGVVTSTDIGRLWKSISWRVQMRNKAESETNEMITSMNDAAGKEPPAETLDDPDFAEVIKRGADKTLLWWIRIWRLLRRLDGNKWRGLAYRGIGERASESLFRAAVESANEYKTWDSFLKKLGIKPHTFLTKKRSIAGFKLTGTQVAQIYNATKDEGWKAAILKSGIMTEEQVGAIAAQATPAERAAADYIRAFHSKQRPRVTEVIKNVEGRQMGAVEEYAGRIRYKGEAPKSDVEALVEEMTERVSYRVRKQVERGFTLRRTGPPGRVPVLGLYENFISDITSTMNVIHNMPTVYELRLILENENWQKSADNIVRGSAAYIRQWLDDGFGLGATRRKSEFELFAGFLRRNSVQAALGLNILSVLRSPISLAQSVGWRAPDSLARARSVTYHALAAAEVARHPVKTIAKVVEKAPWLGVRYAEYELGEIEEAARKKAAILGGLARMLSVPYRAAEKGTITVCWLAQYYRASAEGMSEADAVQTATQSILETQPATRPIDLWAIPRSGEMGRWVSVLQNQINQLSNQLLEDAPQDIIQGARKGGIKGGIKGAGEAAWIWFWGITVTGTLLSLVARGRLPSKEEWLKDQTMYGLGTLPIIGVYIANLIEGYENDPIALGSVDRVFGRGGVAQSAWRGQWGRVLSEGLAGAAQFAGIPTTQPKRTWRGAERLITGKTKDVRELVWGSYQLKPDYMTPEAYNFIQSESSLAQHPELWGQLPRNEKGNVGVPQVKSWLKLQKAKHPESAQPPQRPKRRKLSELVEG